MFLPILLFLSVIGHVSYYNYHDKDAKLERIEQEFLEAVDTERYPPINKLVRFKLVDLSDQCSNPVRWLMFGEQTCTKNIAGICWWETKHRVVVEIDEYYSKFPLLLEQIVWHELAHCYYGLDHGDYSIIMAPQPKPIYFKPLSDIEKQKVINYIHDNYHSLNKG